MGKFYKCDFTGKRLKKTEAFCFVKSEENKLIFDPDLEFCDFGVILSSDPEDVKLWIASDYISEKLDIMIEENHITEQILRYFYNKILTYIALAKKSGKLLLGKKRIEEEITLVRAKKLIIQASDASLGEKFKENDYVELVELYNSEELSSAVGKEMCKYLLVNGDFVKIIKEYFEYYQLLKKINDR